MVQTLNASVLLCVLCAFAREKCFTQSRKERQEVKSPNFQLLILVPCILYYQASARAVNVKTV